MNFSSILNKNFPLYSRLVSVLGCILYFISFQSRVYFKFILDPEMPGSGMIFPDPDAAKSSDPRSGSTTLPKYLTLYQTRVLNAAFCQSYNYFIYLFVFV
jgi:hypothetical protein